MVLVSVSSGLKRRRTRTTNESPAMREMPNGLKFALRCVDVKKVASRKGKACEKNHFRFYHGFCGLDPCFLVC